MGGEPRWKLERECHARAARPDHHLSRQLLQCLRVLRRFPIATREVQLLEVVPRTELAGPEQGDEVVELAQVVLERSRSEEQQVIAVDLLEESIGRGAVILDLVRFIDNDEVPAVAKDLLRVARAAGSVIGGN